MSTMFDQAPQLDSAAVARRLRMYLGDKKLSRKKLSLACGINRTSLGNKLDGVLPFTLDDIAAIAAAIGEPWWWILTGEVPRNDGPPPVQQTSVAPPVLFLPPRSNTQPDGLDIFTPAQILQCCDEDAAA